MSNSDARQQALEARDGFELEPTGLVAYKSGGKVIAIGSDEALKGCDDLPSTVAV